MRLTHAILLATLLASSAWAADVMTFNVQGADPSGGAYTGTVVVEELPAEGVGKGDRFKVTWNTGGDPVVGVGAIEGSNRKVLAVGYVFNGQPGVAVMIEEDGKASGVWAVEGAPGLGTEVWTPVAAAEAAAPPAASAAAITYERAVECAAATSFVVGTLRSTPGADQAKIDVYDKANSAWIFKVGELGKDKKTTERIKDIKAVQAVYAGDPDGLAKATPVADECVATAPPVE